MKSSKRKISLAVVFVLSAFASAAAMAQTAPSLLGGGSSLVAPTIAVELSPTLFPSADGTGTYWSVGSGGGQTAFLNNDATKFTSILANGTTITASGTVDFANSDAPLTTAQITAYSASSIAATSGPLIQIPYIVTPITIPLVNSPATGTGPALPNSTAATVALNDADLCGIFSGSITNWNQVINPDNSSAYPAAPIEVIFRSDNSGTSDLLTAHLAKVCPTPSGTTANPVTFLETQNFGGLFTTLPSNFHSASGGSGVAALLVAARAAGTAAIGYLSPDFTNTFLAPSSAPALANNLSVASLRNTATRTDVTPTFGNATTAIGTVKLPTSTNANDPSVWVPNASNPTAGYPISGTSQIILSQCYANPHNNTPSVAGAIVDFLKLHYTSNVQLLHDNGFDAVPTNLKTLINTDFLTSTNSLNLGIGNTTTCGNFAGR
jgi:ABC-type phosphate transport system substrate-binding protein